MDLAMHKTGSFAMLTKKVSSVFVILSGQKAISIFGLVADILGIIFLYQGTVLSNMHVAPVKRGFFCNDKTIQYPKMERSIFDNYRFLSLFVFILPSIIIVLVEVTNFKIQSVAYSKIYQYFLFDKKVHPACVAIYRNVGVFLCASLVNMAIVTYIKPRVGRLKPNFIAVCQPDVNCSSTWNQNRYIDRYECGSEVTVVPTGDAFTDTEVARDGFFVQANENNYTRIIKTSVDTIDARQSFPSEHAAAVSTAVIYIVLYIERRLLLNWMPGIRLLVQSSMIAFASFIGYVRINKFKNHPEDVLAGFIIGAIIAILFVVYNSDVYKQDFKEPEEGNVETYYKDHRVSTKSKQFNKFYG